MTSTENPASSYLLTLARRNAAAYAANPKTAAILVMGSAAEGESDYYSDLDMSVYYEELLTDEEFAAARQQNGGSELLWQLGDRAEGSFAESYRVEGVECQFAHTTVAAWERDMAVVREKLDVASPLQKALEGLQHGIPLHGEALLRKWQAEAAHYPEALAAAMVEHHLAFFPLWYVQERFITRDTTLWYYQILVESVQHLLGILAGLNSLYYSTFQFKRMRRFTAQMAVAPNDISTRLESLFSLDRRAAIAELEALVAETVVLVEQRMPQIDTSRAKRLIGQRQQAWRPAE